MKKQKKVCLIIPTKLPVPSIQGGAVETLVTLLLDQNEIYNKVYFIIISTWSEGIEKISAKYKNAEFHYVKLRKSLWKKGINFINYLIANVTGKIDFFKTPQHFDIENIIRLIESDFVVVEHGIYKHFEFLQKYFNKDKLFLHLHGTGPTLDRKTRETFGHIITVSKFLEEFYQKKYITSKTKFHVCLNGIDDSSFKNRISTNEKRYLRQKYGVSENDFLILYCGRLIEEKGVKELIQGVLATKNLHIKLMIVGGANFKDSKITPYVRELKNLAENSRGQIFFTGYIENSELYKYYQCADLQAICSLCEEAAGLVVVEGQMSGLPLLLTDSGGIPEYLASKPIAIINKNNALIDYNDRVEVAKQITRELNHYTDLHRSHCDTSCNLDKITQFTANSFYHRFISIFEQDNNERSIKNKKSVQ